jgi:predicted NAD/FAD-binding protein
MPRPTRKVFSMIGRLAERAALRLAPTPPLRVMTTEDRWRVIRAEASEARARLAAAERQEHRTSVVVDALRRETSGNVVESAFFGDTRGD